MPRSFTVTVPDDDLAVLDWALQSLQAGEDPPTDLDALVQRAVETMVVDAWGRERDAAITRAVQDAVTTSTPPVRIAVAQALAALQTMTPEQQLAALASIADPVQPTARRARAGKG